MKGLEGRKRRAHFWRTAHWKQGQPEGSLAVNAGIMKQGGYGERLSLDNVFGAVARMKGGKKVHLELSIRSSEFL